VSTPLTVVPGRVPAVVAHALLPYEQSVIAVRQHPAVLVAPTLAAVGGLIAASVLSFLNLSGAALGVIWAVCGLALLYWLLCLARWPVSYFAVTSQRLLLIRGFMSRDVITIPLSRATELALRRPGLGRLLGYGHFIVYGAGPRLAIRRANYMPYPEQLYIEVVGLIYKDPVADEDG
jgi:membrane protein YdbS with pleckstrin-like domain